jgi:hypothetical protein
VEVNLTIREYEDGSELPFVENRFIRRSYDHIFSARFDLTGGVGREISTNLSTIEFIYVKVTGTATDINLYKNLSPESLEFSDSFLAWEAEGVTKITLKADADTEVFVCLGGS